MKCKKLLAIILSFVLLGTIPGMISSLAAVSEDGVIFSFDGSSYYFNWAAAGEGYGEISAIGQIATVGKSEGDLVGEGVYGQSEATANPTNEFRFTVQGDSWSDSDRAKYSSGYLVLTCDIFLNDAFNGFYWTRRGGNTISTKDQTVIAKFVNKNSWNTITTYYEFAANSSGNHTTKTFVNGKLIDTNTSVTAITDTIAAQSGPQDHINMHVYGTQGDTFEFDNVKYYMTNEAPDDIILSTDGTQESWTWTTILGSVSHNVQKDGTDVYTEGETVASGTDNRFLCYFSNQNYSPDTAKYDYIVMTAQIIPYNDSDITRVAWRNRDGSLSVPDSGSGSKAISNALIPGQWNTVTTVYCYDEVLSEPNPAYAKYTSYTYVNGVRVHKMTNAYSVMPSDKTTSAGNRDNWRIQLDVYTASAGAKFGLDNVMIYQTKTAPEAGDYVILSTDGSESSFGGWQAAADTFGMAEHNIPGTAAKSSEDIYTKATTETTNKEFRWFIKDSGFPSEASKYKYLVMSAQIIPYNDSDITRVAWRNRDGSLSVPDSGSGSKAISNALIPGQWNTVTTVYCYDEVLSEPNPAYAKYTSYTYVNGVRVHKMTNAYSVMSGDKTTSGGNRDNWRIQLTVITNDAVSFGLDNVKIYQTNTYPDVTMPTLENTAKYTVVGNKIKVLPGDVAISELSGAKVWDSTLTNQIATGNIADGNIVTVEDGNKITYYTVSTLKNYDVIYGGTAYDGVANTVDTGSLTATVYKPDETEISVIIAQFDKFGNLHKAKVNKVSGSGLVSTSAFDVDAMEDSVITTFVWGDMTALKPLADVVSVVYSTEG